jgi:Timeless protein
MRKDLIPLVLHQSKNKKLIYHVLTILDYLTMQPEKTDGVHYEEHLLYLESYKEQLSDTDFVDALVNILGQVVNVEEKTKYHEQMIAVS